MSKVYRMGKVTDIEMFLRMGGVTGLTQATKRGDSSMRDEYK
jgi:hypothetical protein